MEIPHDPAASHYEHAGKGLRRRDLDPDPIKQFGNWFTAAIEAGIRDVSAMSLATAGRDARPSVRIVLLKGFDQDGFVFFTNYESEKGKQLEANPCAALAFYWIELDRDQSIPPPPHWGGYRVKPDAMEFWQGRPNRLHDRFRYTRQRDGSWLIERLAP
ncbi:MAG: pyridoxamine 5'-phosphate oxidase [Verrucomicrobia bacterium]|nr:MAG: pyridoxamine 5'-phosphate oxidase [Verrucomicrobiota bacterium]